MHSSSSSSHTAVTEFANGSFAVPRDEEDIRRALQRSTQIYSNIDNVMGVRVARLFVV